MHSLKIYSNIRRTALCCRKNQIPSGPFLRHCHWGDSTKFATHNVEKIRNIGIFAVDSGPSQHRTLTERIIFDTGRNEAQLEAKGENGLGITADPVDCQGGIPIKSAATYTLWKDHNINIIDTPRHLHLATEVKRTLRVLDGAILAMSSVHGVQNQAFTVNRHLKRCNVPCLAFINKVDLTYANPVLVLDEIRNKLNRRASFIQLPIGLEKNCRGVVDLVEQKAIYFDGSFGGKLRYDEIPRDMRMECNDRQMELLQHLIAADTTFCQMYIDKKPIGVADIKTVLRRACLRRSFTPVLVGTDLKNKGVQHLLDAVVDYLPNPGEVYCNKYALKEQVGAVTRRVALHPARNDRKSFVGLAFKSESHQDGQLTYMRCYQGKLQRGDHVYNARTREQMRVDRLVRMHSDKMEDVNEVYAGDIFAVFGMNCSSGDTFVKDLKQNIFLESNYIPKSVVSMAVKPENLDHRDNFEKILARFAQEDPTFHVETEEFFVDNRQTVISGMGKLHLDFYLERMEWEYNCPVVTGKPKVHFRETLMYPCHFDYLVKEKPGGQGQYARVIGVLEPLPPQKYTQLEFVDETVDNSVPERFLLDVKKGFLDMAEKGREGGPKLSGLKFRLQNGAHHLVDSTDPSFYFAAQGAIKRVFENGVWQLLQPLMSVEITAPEILSCQQAVLSQLRKRYGLFKRSESSISTKLYFFRESREDWFTLSAEVPLQETFRCFDAELWINSLGQGEYTMEYGRYAPTLCQVQQPPIGEYEQILHISPPRVFENGMWHVMHPIMNVTVTAPEEHQDTVMSQLKERHGLFNGIERKEGWVTLDVEVALNELVGYAEELRLSTWGKGEFTVEYCRYQPTCPEVQALINGSENGMGKEPVVKKN